MKYKHNKFILLYIFTTLLLQSCNNTHNMVYCKSAYAIDYFTNNILDDEMVYTPQQYKNKMLDNCICDTNEIKKRTITDSFRVDEIYYGDGGLYGFVLLSLSSMRQYEIISIDQGVPGGYKKIEKGQIYRLSIYPYFNRTENTYVWETEEPMYLDGKYVMPAYYLGITNIYLSSDIKGLYYLPSQDSY